MASAQSKNEPLGVHFVGSLPDGLINQPDEGWQKVFSDLPGRFRRISAGELGKRHYFERRQDARFHPAVARSHNVDSL